MFSLVERVMSFCYSGDSETCLNTKRMKCLENMLELQKKHQLIRDEYKKIAQGDEKAKQEVAGRIESSMDEYRREYDRCSSIIKY